MAWSLLPPQYRPLEYGPSETQDPSAIFWACVDSSILSSKSLTYWNDLRTRNDRINVVSPRLHHPCAVLEIGCLVVRGTDLVALLVRQLPLDHVRTPAELIQYRARGAPEPVRREMAEAQAIKGVVERGI